LLKRFARRPLLCLLGVIGFKAGILAISLAYRDDPSPLGLPFLYPIIIFITNFRIESMAIGGIGAYLIFTRREMLLRLIFHPLLQLVILVFMALNATVIRSTGLIGDAGLSVLYTLFILIVAANPHPLLNLETPYLSALGKSSYGIYMFHPAIIYTVLVILSKLGFTDATQAWYNPLLYLIVIALTLIISATSYHYFEMPFLRLKSRLAVIRSGDTISGTAGNWLDRFLPSRRTNPVVK
jgi:peptidoglycan/LPS O-acetylase OafA/YrhL